MNESETRAALVDPFLKSAGWGTVDGSKVLHEYRITDGEIQAGGKRANPLLVDYILVYKGLKIAVIEAKSIRRDPGEGVVQAKKYATLLQTSFAYTTNGKEFYEINMDSGREGLVRFFPSPDELWAKLHKEYNAWRDAFNAIPFEGLGDTKGSRYYQDLAVNKTMSAIAEKKTRILLTLAAGTGKTFIAFQIAWKLFQSRWNLKQDGTRRPRILFLTDRNILANQAYNEFSSFPEDARTRIKPSDIRKKGKVPTNDGVFFTIFHTFMSGTAEDGKSTPYFGEYPKDFFDFIIIDECHRGGANDESVWRSILAYFAPAVQLGLTAAPKRKDNVSTYKYFGDPVYVYSLKQGINDGFLTPYKIHRVMAALDSYAYVSDDTTVAGEVEDGHQTAEQDFDRSREIKEREAKLVRIVMDQINQNDKTIAFCATQTHAAEIRDLVNQCKTSANPDYCVRVTANDGETGDRFLSEFQDNEKDSPTILTTSQKLSAGVNMRNVRNIVLFRPVNSMIEFKQIVGRGTRLFEGKDCFTIYDFVDATKHFFDPEWDGEPLESEPCKRCGRDPCMCETQSRKPCTPLVAQ